MKVLFDICHPAHYHFFKNAMDLLEQEGHTILITSRNKEMTTTLLDSSKHKHHMLTPRIGKGVFGLFWELIHRNIKLTRFILKHKPNALVAIGGTFISHSGYVSGIPSIIFYDTENAKLQNLITYPFCTKLYVPNCYSSWTPKNKTSRYPGYHELAYLHPKYFTPDKSIALKNGLSETSPTYFIRIVSWQANHDIGEKGWDLDLLDTVIQLLTTNGDVIISSERLLPEKYKHYIFKGDVSEIHHLLAYCHVTITESATMASEAAILGIPSLYIASTSRGYVDEISNKYKLIKQINNFNTALIKTELINFLSTDNGYYQQNHERLLQESTDVTELIISSVINTN